MPRLVVLADDMTGALDTGVQFAKDGISTKVTVGTVPAADCTVAVCDMETRHVAPRDAYAATAEAIKNSLAAGAEYLYVKTDSGLRGNIGAQLEALAECGKVFFAPSFPKNKRLTIDGVHLIDGVPVSQSLFGKDSLNPVKFDKLTDLLADNGNVKAVSLKAGSPIPAENGVYVGDAKDDEELADWADEIVKSGVKCLSGCAGFANQLQKKLGFEKSKAHEKYPSLPLLVVCGSISPVSLEQLRTAKEAGIACFTLEDAEKNGVGKMVETAEKEGAAIIASAYGDGDIGDPSEAAAIAKRLGKLVQEVEDEKYMAVMVIGGDTLMGAIGAMSGCSIEPSVEVESGVVACHLSYKGKFRPFVTKSGSFGSPKAILNVRDHFK